LALTALGVAAALWVVSGTSAFAQRGGGHGGGGFGGGFGGGRMGGFGGGGFGGGRMGGFGGWGGWRGGWGGWRGGFGPWGGRGFFPGSFGWGGFFPYYGYGFGYPWYGDLGFGFGYPWNGYGGYGVGYPGYGFGYPAYGYAYNYPVATFGPGFGYSSAYVAPGGAATTSTVGQRRYLGIDEQPITESNGKRAIKVGKVYPGTAAEKAGLQVGDVIQSINGYLTEVPGNLAWVIANAATDNVLKMNVRSVRDGKDHAITATLP
jgi:hypothetical protein